MGSHPYNDGTPMNVAHSAFADLPPWHGALLLAPSALAASAAVAITRSRTVSQAWRLARVASGVMVFAAVVALGARTLTPQRSDAVVRSDSVGAAVLLLVAVVGWVCIRYSAHYLRGDPHEVPYVRRLLATLAAVLLVVVANNIAVLTVAWTLTSLALHRLLTFFGDRSAAIAAAHKKFILARVADACMIGAVVAFVTTFETFRIDQIAADAVASSTLPTGARIGVLLIAVAAVLKCSQLPFHGWLIQVMEAPTPVSALLHAGVVNLGGVVLLRFAPVVDRSSGTQVLLVLIGTGTAVAAALVMTTRISVKVSLAWSTCAQMGFMLMECGLGAWGIALLHLLAHSLYKAHAFLAAGGTVRQFQRKQLVATIDPPGVRTIMAALIAASAVTVTIGWLWARLPFAEPLTATAWLLGAIVALALVPLMPLVPHIEVGRMAQAFVGVLAVPLAYFGLHDLFSHLVPSGDRASTALVAVVAVLFLGLFVVQTALSTASDQRWVRRLYPWIFGGLFLDEQFTRLAFHRWPPPAAAPRFMLLPVPTSVVVESFA